ncbi:MULTISPECIES: DUF6647 family protein [unclassified Mesorhizobium]|uniref:DUF6647 family protein n=1 Tax=unclassified Mesorhizobium TaxID=325217 RepID=UPI000F754BE8|nr:MULTISPECIES: DUF6647 family protein [unclassified Mesorhizobium]AZO72938.1 hypothetical protein EJ067_18465 [Mesorhizobium sp. M1D.F.Ca.ET.043.01.1.1]RWA90818.1 MAG: hypothetical protein EOQ32_18265 [Mesorhizobium sp.]RWE03963.1 MAG: hypothetical protein EOS61_26535 [Mesorhizobium sp.]
MREKDLRLLRLLLVSTLTSLWAQAKADDFEVQAQSRPNDVPAAVLPGTGFVVRPGYFETGNESLRPLLEAIAVWLSSEFDLPPPSNPPTISWVPAERLSRLRFRGLPSDHWGGEKADILAVYDDDARTIYLPAGWNGRTPAELSILAHEMVHHLQNLAGLKFACPQEREQIAYEAQQRWLRLFGSDLAADFQIDGFMLLVLTNCPM